MRITRVSVDNWRNFKHVSFGVGNRLFIVGPNASGKSNLLDVFRFMSDVAGLGGGIAAAIAGRGGLGKVRSLFARNHKNGRLVLEFELSDGDDRWVYRLAVKGEAKGRNRPVVDEEFVSLNDKPLLQRPDDDDRGDIERLTQTHLEQIAANREFRDVAEFFKKTTYFHLVPQVIRDSTRSGGRMNDPYGGDFIAAINATPTRMRQAWLKRMQKALQAAVPEFESLGVEVDSAGRPHLTAGYRNWRSSPTRHSETEFSDGTLRLIGLLWTVVSAPRHGGVLLLEEPELSLNSAVVRMLPSVLATAQRGQDRQVILSTHAPELLDDEGVLAEEILVLRVTKDGTEGQLLSSIPEVQGEVEAELPTSEIVHGLIAPQDLRGLISIGAG